MSNKLGQILGKRRTALSITNDAKENVKISIYIDYSSASDAEIGAWLDANRTIAGQRPWRKLSANEIAELDGRTFLAQTIGQKVKSRDEQIAELVAIGIPKKLAEIAVDNPDRFAAAMATTTETIDESTE